MTKALLATVLLVAVTTHIPARAAQTSPAGAAPPARPIVSTIAGSGAMGLRDGDANSAEFMDPVGLAYGPNRMLYIVDRTAQRIRVLTPTGIVRTIAGSGRPIDGLGVGGSYADGAALGAKFNNPVAIAVAKDGSLFVADTKNHCIRKIKDGIVSTFVGAPSRIGDDDGNLSTSSFNDPRSLAFDSTQDLFVADFPNGIRKISPQGAVTTTKTTLPTVAVAVGKFLPRYFKTNREVLMAASVKSIQFFDPVSMALLSEVPVDSNYNILPPRQAMLFLGPPISLAAFNEYSYVYADPLFRTVRWMTLQSVNVPESRTLGEEPLENAARYGGKFRDGPGDHASFVDPTAVTRAPDGSIIVADGGARRIRRLGPFDTRSVEMGASEGEFPSTPDPEEYRIAIVGNSYVDSVQPGALTFAGVTESNLATLGSGKFKRIRVFSICRAGTSPTELINVINTYFSTGTMNAVILDLPYYQIFDNPLGPSDYVPSKQIPAIISQLREVQKALQSQGVAFYAVYHPSAWDLTGESRYRWLPRTYVNDDQLLYTDVNIRDPLSVYTEYTLFSRALHAANINLIDAWPALLGYRKSPNALPLFSVWDHHFTAIGSEIVGDAIAKRLEVDHPWTRGAP